MGAQWLTLAVRQTVQARAPLITGLFLQDLSTLPDSRRQVHTYLSSATESCGEAASTSMGDNDGGGRGASQVAVRHLVYKPHTRYLSHPLFDPIFSHFTHRSAVGHESSSRALNFNSVIGT